MDIITKEFPEHRDESGALTFIEGEHHIPFAIARVYYIYQVTPEKVRGHHAHKELEQYLMCVHGTCTVVLDDGIEKETVVLDAPNKGLYVGSNVWRTMEFSQDAVLLVLASQPYEEPDYIRDYGEFLAYVQEKKEKKV